MSVRMSKERTKQKYSQEFKENAVQLCLARSTTVRQIAAELGVTEKILHRWKRELAASKSTGIRFAPGSGNARDEELEILRKENKRLKDDVEILTKAAAYFAQHAR
jgi:transposase